MLPFMDNPNERSPKSPKKILKLDEREKRKKISTRKALIPCRKIIFVVFHNRDYNLFIHERRYLNRKENQAYDYTIPKIKQLTHLSIFTSYINIFTFYNL